MHSPAFPHRWRALLVAATALVLMAGPAGSIELFEGRVQIHGFGETQIRSIARDYDFDEIDLTQWYLIGNVELEVDLAPEGFGPIDLMGAFVRVEGRYDCVWSRACGMFNSVNTYGDRSERLPDRLADARKNVFRGTLHPDAVVVDTDGTTRSFFDNRPRLSIPLGQDGVRFATGPLARPVPGRNRTGRLWHVPALGQLFFGLPGLDPDGLDGNLNPVVDPGLGDDDVSGCFTGNTSSLPCRYAGAYVSERFFGYRFGTGATRGPTGGNGSTVLGPWRPKDRIISVASLSDRVNPFDEDSTHPVLVDPDDPGMPLGGAGDLPFRPRAEFSHTADANRDGTVDGDDAVGLDRSRGLYYPGSRLARTLADSDFDVPAVNFRERDLAFNRGDAQDQTYELKEAYLDIEVLDHALWIRAGRQTIVWGKTELFRSQDQFNPQDLGLSSLPSLEESRVPLWALRAIYSVYDVGPFEDVRIEGAMLIDEFQPIDFGRCGEPYSPPQSCTLAAGLFGHGLVGQGLAGQFLPEDPWDDYSAIEGGVRLEWRWNRVSFALTEWVGYPDLPHLEVLQEYTRNVDPRSGRPRPLGESGSCVDGTEEGCFEGGVDASFTQLARPETDDVLANHHANQQLFATICASTLGISALRPEACAFNIWNNQQIVDSGNPTIQSPTLAIAFSAMLHGDILGKATLGTLARWDTDGDLNLTDLAPGGAVDNLPLATLHVNSNTPGGGPQVDGGTVGFRILAFPDECGFPPDPNLCAPGDWQPFGLDPVLTDQQEAVLGCGDYWGSDCDIHGFDLLNAEASALVQSWPGFEGAGGSDWDPFDGSIAQPGTIGFDGGPICTRFDRATAEMLKLPGCRGVQAWDLVGGRVVAMFDPGYTPEVDGCVFSAQIGGLDVDGVYADDGSDVDLTNCETGPGALDTSLFHPVAGCPVTALTIDAGLTCIFDLNPGRDFDAEFLAGSAQIFSSELAALSWNLLMVLVTASLPPDKIEGDATIGITCDPQGAQEPDDCSDRAPRFDEFNPRDPERLDGCSIRRPFLCKSAGPFFAVTGARRATVRAGGSSRYGRRDFTWHAGGIGTLDYKRRNVLGFSFDFPEDRTGSNWGFEFTWFDKVMLANNDEFDGLSEVQQFNLSMSVDRPTFIRFLNSSRTFLFNSQLFLQYVEGYKKGMPSNGPLNATATLLAATAYHQDRLIPTLTLVHDFNSVSGAIITGLTYRYTTHFSVGVGAAAFYGRIQTAPAALTSIAGASGGAGKGSNRSYVENGLSSIRDRDELFLRFRYTF